MEARSSKKRRLTRRHVLKTGAAALGAGTGLLNVPPVLNAQSTQAPAVVTGTQTGRSFRGLVRHASTLDVQEMRLLPIDPRQVVIRSLAVAPCYTIVRGALSTNPTQRAEVPNHCGFGVVEAVGPMVKRVQVGDRVVVAGTSQCGQCYQCLQGRPDYCQFTFFSNAQGVDAVSSVCPVAGRHACIRAGRYRRNERAHDPRSRSTACRSSPTCPPRSSRCSAISYRRALPRVTQTCTFNLDPMWSCSAPGRSDLEWCRPVASQVPDR